MQNICVLDVTLRDGGNVNNFNFGQQYMTEILHSLEESGIEYIELGYIDEKNGSLHDRTQFINEKAISECLLKSKKQQVYLAMLDYGKFDVSNLNERTADSIDGIRVCFHKKDWKNAISTCKQVLEKGYEVYVQPMLTMRYSDMELLQLISTVNQELPDASAMYVVDSFGEMRPTDVLHKMRLLDNNLSEKIKIGFHSHNNLQLAYSNAMSLLELKTSRTLILDASVMGMGKGAGNLNTELLLEHLNLHNQKNYDIGPLLSLVDRVIGVIHREFYWGYSVEYYLSSIYRCTPSYASHFYNKHMLPIDQVAELLSLIPDEKRISFDKSFAEKLYLEYNSNKEFDDSETIAKLKEEIEGKKVLIIAPGRSINDYKDVIQNKIKEEDMVSISLNNCAYSTDFCLITRSSFMDTILEKNNKIICPSNVSNDTKLNLIDYKKWIITGEKTYDSAGVISINLMLSLKPTKVYLAGFDGFTLDINKNYFDKAMRHQITEEQVEVRNSFYKKFIETASKKIPFEFLTPSIYQRENE